MCYLSKRRRRRGKKRRRRGKKRRKGRGKDKEEGEGGERIRLGEVEVLENEEREEMVKKEC